MLESQIDVPEALAGQTAYDGLALPIYSLFRRINATGARYIENRTFTNCRLEGPAVFLVLDGVFFDRCNMGAVGGDVRNMLLKPMGPQIIGAIPFQNCRFENCTFYGVGFTGNAEFLSQMERMPQGAPA